MRFIIKYTISLILQYKIRFVFDKVLGEKNIYVVALLYGISLACRMRANATFCLSDSEFQTGQLKIKEYSLIRGFYNNECVKVFLRLLFQHATRIFPMHRHMSPVPYFSTLSNKR
jgi:hypothetical protein